MHGQNYKSTGGEKRKQGGKTQSSRRFSRGHISYTAPRDTLEVDGARETKRNVQVRSTEATRRGTQRLEKCGTVIHGLGERSFSSP